MLRPFSGTTLIDICLKKLGRFKDYDVYFGAAEEEFLELAREHHNIKVINRSQQSADSDSDARKIFETLNYISSPYVCWINPSHPFLQVQTVEEAINLFLKNDARSLTSVVLKKGWFYDLNGKPLTNLSISVDTSLSDGIYAVAHAFHIYERKRMLETGRPWDNKDKDPLLFEIPTLEASDIDTENEFIMAEALYKSYSTKRR